jgi:hypothetical protein
VDEHVTGPRKKPKSMDDMALAGCASFTFAAAAQWIAVFVPFAMAQSLHTKAELQNVVLVCTGLASLVGAISSAILGLAGFCGTMGGLVPGALFAFLRIRHELIGVPGIEGMEPAQFPQSSQWTAPLMIAFTCASISFTFYWIRRKR